MGPMADKYTWLRNVEKLTEILRRHVPAIDGLSDTALVADTMTQFQHWRGQPLIDPNE